MYYLGYDIGSSSIKAALVDSETNNCISIGQFPKVEMEISSLSPGWAEQDPEMWWTNLIAATEELLTNQPKEISSNVVGIGISYQMHGLVLVDEDQLPIRPSIIWCDSRAVETGNAALRNIGEDICYSRLLNSPGNFTASKLKWVKENEPASYERIHKIMLPGDYIGMKLTGEIITTPSGLSEGILWDFVEQKPASFIYEEFGINESMIPNVLNSFSLQGNLSKSSAQTLRLPIGIPVAYRGGDQPNNAVSLGVLEPGEVAATGGTSGVIYGVADLPTSDVRSRVNSFAHVNHSESNPRIGILLCINGTGIQYAWINKQMASNKISYQDMERMASEVNAGSEGLTVIPFGNGAERMFENRIVGSHLLNIDLNRHHKEHFYRATLEGIAFSFTYGLEILSELGLSIDSMKVGNDNLFQSGVFSRTLAKLSDISIEVIETTGAVGAAKAVGFTLGHRNSIKEAMAGSKIVGEFTAGDGPDQISEHYDRWKSDLAKILKKTTI